MSYHGDAPDRIPEFVVGYVIEFSDGGPDEGGILHVGSLESCKHAANMMHAVTYSGNRPVRGASMRIVQKETENETR